MEEKLKEIVQELADKRNSHPATKLLNERVAETTNVSIKAGVVAAGITDLADIQEVAEDMLPEINEEATEAETRMMTVELLWDIRKLLSEMAMERTSSTTGMQP